MRFLVFILLLFVCEKALASNFGNFPFLILFWVLGILLSLVIAYAVASETDENGDKVVYFDSDKFKSVFLILGGIIVFLGMIIFLADIS